MSGNGEPGPAPRRIVVEFVDGPPPDCRILPDPTILATDLYLAAWLMDALAREVRAATVAAAPRLEIGRPGMLGHLAPGGAPRRS